MVVSGRLKRPEATPWAEYPSSLVIRDARSWPEQVGAGSAPFSGGISPGAREDTGDGDRRRLGEPQLPFGDPFEGVVRQYTHANSASRLILSGRERYTQRAYPEPEYDHPSVDHLLSNRVEKVLRGLFPILKRQATLSFAPTSSVEVWGLANPEDESHRVTVTQWVRLPSKEALRYWDRLAVAVGAWTATLPDHLAAVVDERIVVEVRRKRRDGGI